MGIASRAADSGAGCRGRVVTEPRFHVQSQAADSHAVVEHFRRMAHLAARAFLGFAIEAEAGVAARQNVVPGENVGTDEVAHLDPRAVTGGGAERPAADGADVLLE